LHRNILTLSLPKEFLTLQAVSFSTLCSMAPITDRFFIALLPPLPLMAKLHELKEYFAEHHNSKAALRSPPHITLLMPFLWRLDKIDRVEKTLIGLTQSQPTFPVELSNFGAFAPRVIYVDVLPEERLNQLQSGVAATCRTELNLFNDKHKKGFSPHITVAFRDLRKAEFHQAWESFQQRNFSGNFEADSLTLLKHDGKQWEVFRQFPFGDNPAI